MSSQKNSYQFTIQIIADILSFENSVEALKQKMISNLIDWDQFVYVASDFLVLTTCYCKLKEKGLLDLIPEELSQYLEDLTAINRNRNITLLNEIKHIAKIFNENKINYVFLKGSAYLVKDHFKDFGERMLGDIDILVEESQTETSYQLLLNNNYKATEQGISAKYFNHKHLPKLQSDTNLAAVEIHKKVLLKPLKNHLIVGDILSTKKCINGINVPSNKHLFTHTILNFQSNDSGLLLSRISLKSIYDVLILSKTYHPDYDDILKTSHFKNYFSIAKIFFDDFRDFKTLTSINMLFLIKLKHPWLRKIIDSIIQKAVLIKTFLTSRIWTFIRNKNYRKDIINEYGKIFGLAKLKNS